MSWFSDVLDWAGDVGTKVWHEAERAGEDVWREAERIAEDVWREAERIGEQIGDAATDAWDWVEDNVDWVVLIIMVCVAIYCWYLIPELMATYSAMQSAQVVLYMQTASTWAAMSMYVSAYWIAVSSAWSAFLTAIYFEQLVLANNLALLVSPEYRQMVIEVFVEISKVSAALGFGPHFLTLAFMNMRSLVLDVSSLMGTPYDLGQVQWLAFFAEHLKALSTRLDTYKNNPGQFILDMESMVDKPFIDTKAAYVRTLIKTLDSVIIGVETTIKTITLIRDDINKLVADLPESMRKEIKPFTDKITKEFDDFLKDDFNPELKKLNGLISVLNKKQEEAKGKMGNLVDRLKNPGEYIREVDVLPDIDRVKVENYLADLTTRTPARQSAYISTEMEPVMEGLQQLAGLLGKEFPKPAYEVVEIETPVRPAGIPAKLRKTWFVGDY